MSKYMTKPGDGTVTILNSDHTVLSCSWDKPARMALDSAFGGATREGFSIPTPRPGDGTTVFRHRDGSMSYSRDRLAMDAAIGGPKGSPNFASYNATGDIDDINEPDNEGFDLGDKIRALLEGKLDEADISALIALIQPDDTDTAMPAQDRRGRRQAHDRRSVMPSRATMERLVAEGAARRAEGVLKQHASLMDRFPALKNARVGG